MYLKKNSFNAGSAEWLNDKVHAYNNIVVQNINLSVKFYSPFRKIAQKFEEIDGISLNVNAESRRQILLRSHTL